MIDVMIIDDEPAAVNTLSLMIERYIPEIRIIQTSNDPVAAITFLTELKPELVFLDIQMPVMTGFDLLKKLPSIDFSVIFTTAHDQYAIEAIRFSALDYLMKPIDADELKNAIGRFISIKEQTKTNQQLYQNFLNNISAKDEKDFKLAIPTTDGTFFYKPDEIIRIEGENNYSRFFFSNKKNLLTSRTLKEYEEILARFGFLRVHKSHLINKAFVKAYSADGLITMQDQSQVEISRRRKEEVISALKSQ